MEKVVERKNRVGGQRRRGVVKMTRNKAKNVYNAVPSEKRGMGAERSSYSISTLVVEQAI